MGGADSIHRSQTASFNLGAYFVHSFTDFHSWFHSNTCCHTPTIPYSQVKCQSSSLGNAFSSDCDGFTLVYSCHWVRECCLHRAQTNMCQCNRAIFVLGSYNTSVCMGFPLLRIILAMFVFWGLGDNIGHALNWFYLFT